MSGRRALPHRVVGALMVDGGAVLLCHRRSSRSFLPDLWDVPGGHVQPGEDPGDALVREIFEELGVQVARPSCPPLAILTDEALGVDLTLWCVDDWLGAVSNCAPREHDEIRWFASGELDELEFVHTSIGVLADSVMRAQCAMGGGEPSERARSPRPHERWQRPVEHRPAVG